ncbi:PREDICTED: uncharacterized protein LOC108750260 [Trachymyrmex septentrionalis]|uniref:uncharacterized protein LOC108750260 n=1 Tax=Trachymyrmex septentrionalis TaxID=34720 RepID=UPI00084F0997|nr:PREDICTED: uncharacterized protein LOC108750260 [Trachymyrmex septentrionalis]
MRAGCYFEVPREIATKRAVINVNTMDNACFAWSVVAALYPAEKHVERESSYLHYTAVLNLAGIEFPITFKDIPKFERLNAVSINVYGIENKQVFPLRLTSDKKDKHDGVGHFAWIKNLSRLVSSQLSKKEHKKYFCDRCLHYFSTNEKLQSHTMDCQKINDCAIRLPSEDEKWLEFGNHCNKERVPFVVYADLECVLRKTEPEREDASSYAYQWHEVFSISYYVRCSYDDALSSYQFRRDKDCIAWFARQLNDLAHRVKNIVSANVPMETLSKEQWEAYRSATRCHICEKPFASDDTRDTRLPPRESFYSSLTGDTVSESDYTHAANVWQRFSIQTFGEYSDLYLKIDVLLLADIFENFRESCVASYGLDPAHCYTFPGFTWDANICSNIRV